MYFCYINTYQNKLLTMIEKRTRRSLNILNDSLALKSSQLFFWLMQRVIACVKRGRFLTHRK